MGQNVDLTQNSTLPIQVFQYNYHILMSSSIVIFPRKHDK